MVYSPAIIFKIEKASGDGFNLLASRNQSLIELRPDHELNKLYDIHCKRAAYLGDGAESFLFKIVLLRDPQHLLNVVYVRIPISSVAAEIRTKFNPLNATRPNPEASRLVVSNCHGVGRVWFSMPQIIPHHLALRH